MSADTETGGTGALPEALLDALNIAWWCGAPPSLRLPLAAADALLAAGRTPRLVFDASAPYQLPEAEGPVYEAGLSRGSGVLQVPSGETADRFLLEAAKAGGGCIVSRDRFRDHRRGYKSIVRNPLRRLDGFVSEDRLRLPVLELDVALPPTAEAAWRQLQVRLAG